MTQHRAIAALERVMRRTLERESTRWDSSTLALADSMLASVQSRPVAVWNARGKDGRYMIKPITKINAHEA